MILASTRSSKSAGGSASRSLFIAADPEAFFHPIDASNERYEELIEHPDWSFYGKDFPSLQELMEARNRMFAKHPNTSFVSLHMGWPENLPWVATMLDQHPNAMVEFGAREAELGRAPHRIPRVLPEISGPHHVRNR